MRKNARLAIKLRRQAEEQEKAAALESCIIPIKNPGRGWVKFDELVAAEINPIHERYGRREVKKHAVDWTVEPEDAFLSNANSFTDVDKYCENDDDCFREICLESSNSDEEPEPAENNSRVIDCQLFKFFKPKLNFVRLEKVGNKNILTVASFGLTLGGF